MSLDQEMLDKKTIIRTELTKFTVPKLTTFCSAVKIPFKVGQQKYEIVDLITEHLLKNNLLDQWRETFEANVGNLNSEPNSENTVPDKPEVFKNRRTKLT